MKRRQQRGSSFVIPMVMLGLLIIVGNCISLKNRFLLQNSKMMSMKRSSKEIREYLENTMSCLETITNAPAYCNFATLSSPQPAGLFKSEFDLATPDSNDRVVLPFVIIPVGQELSKSGDFYLRAFCVGPKTFLVESAAITINTAAERLPLITLPFNQMPWQRIFDSSMTCY